MQKSQTRPPAPRFITFSTRKKHKRRNKVPLPTPEVRSFALLLLQFLFLIPVDCTRGPAQATAPLTRPSRRTVPTATPTRKTRRRRTHTYTEAPHPQLHCIAHRHPIACLCRNAIIRCHLSEGHPFVTCSPRKCRFTRARYLPARHGLLQGGNPSVKCRVRAQCLTYAAERASPPVVRCLRGRD